jgi:hypothetical protein
MTTASTKRDHQGETSFFGLRSFGIRASSLIEYQWRHQPQPDTGRTAAACLPGKRDHFTKMHRWNEFL